ncbi:MAG TPA: hypothetical protein VMW38_08890 [Terriglobia bacterium]|nr:hypothetical protein [Terriglobia bacterium]
MRKTTSKEARKRLVNIEAPKQPPVLDDTAIREILRSTCRELELEEDISGLLMAENIRVLIVQTVEVPSKAIWVTPEYLREKTDLVSLWGIYAQRQVLLFDQDSRTSDDWNEQPLW